MNLPNMLTLSRLGLAAIMMALLTLSFPFAKSLALIVFVVAGITDYLDGYLARSGHGVTAFGKLMDPLTDKVLVCAAFVSFVELRLVPAWIAVIIAAREFLVTSLRLLARTRANRVGGKWGKHKTVWRSWHRGFAHGDGGPPHMYWRASKLLKNYDFCFGYIAFAISAAVAAITLASGMLYFQEHQDLLKQGRD